MKTEHIVTIVGMSLPLLCGIVSASTGMPWERPLETAANSLTGKAGVSAATIGVAWTAINWGRGTEHGKEWFLGTAMGVGGTLGAATIVNVLGGGAGASSLLAPQMLPMALFLSDLVGELLGHLAYTTWVFGGLLAPFVWRKRP